MKKAAFIYLLMPYYIYPILKFLGFNNFNFYCEFWLITFPAWAFLYGLVCYIEGTRKANLSRL